MPGKQTVRISDGEMAGIMLAAAASTPFHVNGAAFNQKFDELLAEQIASGEETPAPAMLTIGQAVRVISLDCRGVLGTVAGVYPSGGIDVRANNGNLLGTFFPEEIEVLYA